MSRLIIYTGRRHTFLGFVIFCFSVPFISMGFPLNLLIGLEILVVVGMILHMLFVRHKIQDLLLLVQHHQVILMWQDTTVGNCAAFQCDDFWIFKVSKNGSLEWAKTMEVPCVIWLFALLHLGPNFIIGGTTFSSDGDVIGNHGGSDAWLIKMDGSGNLFVAKMYWKFGLWRFYSLLELSDKSLIA